MEKNPTDSIRLRFKSLMEYSTKAQKNKVFECAKRRKVECCSEAFPWETVANKIFEISLRFIYKLFLVLHPHMSESD